MPYRLLQGGRRRRHRRWKPAAAALLLAFAATLLLANRAGDPVQEGPPPATEPPAPGPLLDSGTAPLAGGGTAPSPLAVQLDGGRDPVSLQFRRPPRSGLVFDVDSGEVLWRHRPDRVLPIASLTKMMTALVVVERVPEGEKVRITEEALAYTGSGVGLFKRGRRIGVSVMLHGLLLPSGNDAAIALAQHVGGSVSGFVAMMNARARAMGLACTRFSSPSGIRDRGNHSCAPDLAALARAVLRQPRLARIVRRRSAVLPFPIKGGRIYLYNNNPLLRAGYRGTTGVKTGYTEAAGRCIVATVRRGSRRIGAVLLDSPDPGTQARRLFDRALRR
ncbi:MAG TPA: D-alanyl-D-alanine carboxypeptidase family protein [Solirubrobacteraceae bacterium]|nr:D-alanyl-D-alanine carboxypeptidase family protein [Solirubrobacteraceae bacterium]